MSTVHVSIIIADHHTFIRQGIVQALTKLPGHKVSAKVTNGKELLKAIAEFKPALVILEILLPFLNGVHAMNQLITANHDLKVLVISGSGDPRLVQRIIDAGAKGYVMKTGPPDDLAEAIETVMRGDIYYCNEMSPKMQKYARQTEVTGKLKLSEQDEQIMRWCCEGLTAKEIADNLSIKPNTVRGYIKIIQKKAGVKNVAAMSAFAVLHGIYKEE